MPTIAAVTNIATNTQKKILMVTTAATAVSSSFFRSAGVLFALALLAVTGDEGVALAITRANIMAANSPGTCRNFGYSLI